MKPTLAVLGDSFMRPDADYPGLHFSERLHDYDVKIYAQDGASMGMIAYQFDRARADGMHAFVIGLGAHDRLEFWAGEDHGDHSQNRLWFCGNHHALINPDQQQAALAYQLQACPGMMSYKALLLAKSMFLDLEMDGKPYAWVDNLLFQDNDYTWLLQPVLERFNPHRTKINLAAYRPFADRPGFHVPDPEWQQGFADQCAQILTSTVDKALDV